MPRNKKPRKKFTCRRIELPRISEERIDVIIDTMTNVGFSVELKLPNGTFDRDDMRALADFSNLTGVTFNELGEDRLSEEDLISSNELQCALSDSLTSLYLRTYKNKAKFYVPTGEELKTIQEAVTFFLPVMEETVKGKALPQGGFAKSTEIAILNEPQTTLLLTFSKTRRL